MLLQNLFSRAVFSIFALLALSAFDDVPNPLVNTTAAKLAAIDAGTTSITDNQVWPYKALVTKLEDKCDDTPTGISDTAVMARNLFKKHKNRDVSVLSVMLMIDVAVPEGQKLNCHEVIAAIISLS